MSCLEALMEGKMFSAVVLFLEGNIFSQIQRTNPLAQQSGQIRSGSWLFCYLPWDKHIYTLRHHTGPAIKW